MVDIKIDGIESIQHDYDEFNVKVRRASNYGLKAVASELTPCLKKHIEIDVYDAYEPQDYLRRYDNPQYGRSIHSDKNVEWNLRYMGNGEQSLEFAYTPNGRNTHYLDSPYYTDGDSIIDAIQRDSGYLWVGSIGAKRPFWNLFVQDVLRQGDEWFVRGFNSMEHSLQARSDRTLVGEARDYNLSPTFSSKTEKETHVPDWDDDDELPF